MRGTEQPFGRGERTLRGVHRHPLLLRVRFLRPGAAVRPRATVRGISTVAVVALVAFGLSACGGGSPGAGVASLGTSGSTTSSAGARAGSSSATRRTRATSAAAMEKDALEFSKCMRTHGVPEFPDPENGGRFVFNVTGGPNPDSPEFKAAQDACRRYMPDGGNPTPEQSSKDKAQLLDLAKCMRSHGVTGFPDPTSRANGGWGFTITQTSLHVTSPTYQEAAQACQKSVPGAGGVPCGGKRRGRYEAARVRRC